jgi:hypothetical protein
MNKPFYEFEILEEALRFEFTSVGRRRILKAVVYAQTNMPTLYSLSMGDVKPDQTLDFETISDNGDRDQILATVIQTLLAFFGAYPTALVAFTGSTPARTRLYQILLAREFDKASVLFNCWGLNETGDIKRFSKNRAYAGFIISLKDNPVRL